MSGIQGNRQIPIEINRPVGKTSQTPATQQAGNTATKPQTQVQKPVSDQAQVKDGTQKKADFNPNEGVKFNPQAKAAAPKTGGSLDNVATFNNSSAATPAQIDKILDHYNSPFKGKGQVISDMCKKYNINPVMMLAIMQQESTFGKASPENAANPFSVHFNHAGKGVAKLRHKDGTKSNMEESLEGAIKTMKKHAGDSSKPFSAAAQEYCKPPGPWITTVSGHYKNLQKYLK